GIQQQHAIGTGGAEALIDRGGESAVGLVRDNFGSVPPPLQTFERGIRRRVIDHHCRCTRRHLSQRLQARLDHPLRVVGDDHGGDSQKYALQYKSKPVCFWTSRMCRSLSPTTLATRSRADTSTAGCTVRAALIPAHLPRRYAIPQRFRNATASQSN